MSAIEWLNWARGPGLQISIVIFLIGMTVRVLELVLLGRKHDYAKPRRNTLATGFRTVWHRSNPEHGVFVGNLFVFVGGYTFHIGFLATLLFFVPHIEFFKSLLGFSWPALPNYIIDAITLVTIAALVALLIHRLMDPVRRYLSHFADYYVWLITLLPILTGYFLMHRMFLPFTEMLAIHILSAELLLISIPFTKLIHLVTFATSRWYNGVLNGRRGISV